MQARRCLKENINELLSVQDQVSCNKESHACDGGSLNSTWYYLYETGIVTESCFPYTSSKGTVESCITKCKNQEKWIKHKSPNKMKIFSTTDDIKQEILDHGPVQTIMSVYTDFMDYDGDYVYEHKKGKDEGAHSVAIIGWGEQDGKKYYLCQNSWGTDWGINGYFKIKITDESLRGIAVANGSKYLNASLCAICLCLSLLINLI